MPIAIHEFWNLAVASGLFSPERCRELNGAYKKLKGASENASVLSLAQWLVAGGVLTRYQASLLAAGRPGPFVFGDYTITDRIDSGRLAPWFRATAGDRRWLIVFAAQLTSDPDLYEMAAERALLAMSVKSPHVSAVREFIDSQPPMIVVEDLAGQSLREQLAAGPLSLQTACRVVFEAALGLVALHERQIVHGGIRPDNLWVQATGATKVLQFPCQSDPLGLAPFDATAVDYLAPERASGEPALDTRSDLYSLGCTLYELVAGRVPFPGGTVQQRITRHRTEVAQRLDAINPATPEEVADLVAEMLDKEPELRCQTASHVAHLLAPFVAGAKPNAARPPQQAPRSLTPGYGAWQAPDWKPPPRQQQPRPPAAKLAPMVAPPAAPTVAQTVAPATPPIRPAAREVIPPEPSTSTAAASVGLPPDPGIPPQASELIAPFEDTPFPPRTLRRPPAGGLSGAVMVGGSALLAAALILAALFFGRSGGDDESPDAAAQPATVEETVPSEDPPKAEPADEDLDADDATAQSLPPARPTVREVDDDGKTLWISPTAGDPLAVRYLPSGIQALLVLRPAELLASAEGVRMLDALGPAGQNARATLRSILGVELAEIEQLAIACYPDDSGAPRVALVMRLLKPQPIERLLAAWNAPAPLKHGAGQYYQNDRWAYWLPVQEQGQVVAITPPAVMPEVLDLKGQPLVPKGFERLLRYSDAARQINLLLVPRYLMTDGASLLSGDLERLREPLLRFFDGGVEAALLSAHLGDALFVEVRVASLADRRAAEVADELKARLDGIAESLKTLPAALGPAAYGRDVIARLPAMVQLAHDYTREGVDHRQAVLDCYLPLAAAHNLLLGAELALSLQPSGPPAATVSAPSTPAQPTAASALEKRISLSFPRDTLERAVELLSQEIGVKIVILGSDLRRQGITKNQSFAIDERDQPAGQILRKILARSNPDGKLVYVIRAIDGGGQAIFITTRDAAQERGEKVGEETAGTTTKESR